MGAEYQTYSREINVKKKKITNSLQHDIWFNA